ncbi:MFS transporter [Undibacterium arcticum]|uniref:MFS transporter n=2 Tax=Undibacterium arcticum TaxID=1762892 RepID=A0ABV7F4U5_9BURK
MTSPAAVDVQEFINSNAFSTFQRSILILCFLVVTIDGFDTASIGFIAPAIKAEWHLSAASLAPLFGAGLFGLMSGALIFGPLADRFGRKPILIFSVAFFGLASFLSVFSTGLPMLLVLRFLTGLGLGGAMPSAVTLTSEYCPQGRRSSLVTLMFCGFTVGSALGGLVAAQMLSSIGWRGVLCLGGVLPLLLVPLLVFKLPESLRFLVEKGKSGVKVARIVRHIAPAAASVPDLMIHDKKITGSPVASLFRQGMLQGTLLLWTTFFMSLLIIYLISSWLPTLLSNSGISLSKASFLAAMFQVGGTAGAILIGRWMDRFNPHLVLAIAYLIAAGFIALIGISGGALWLVVVAVFGAGFCVSGSQVGANALAAAFYPTGNRTTGVSWASAIGRSGSIVGSMIGGLLLSLQLDNQSIFLIAAAPALIGSVAIFMMGRQGCRHVVTPAPFERAV